jgi:hypothetical protein
MSAIRVGTIVTHKAWGVGKVLFLTETKAVVGFAACRTPTDPGLRDVSLRGTFIEPTSSEPDPAPDNWNITLDANGRAAGPRARSTRAAALKPKAAGTAISADQAIARFKERYPTGFEDERYVTLERGWKWEKHVEWHERVGTRSLAEMAKTNLRQLAHDTQRVVQTRRKSLLDKAELAAFTAGLAADAPSRAYFAALDGVLSGEDDDLEAFTALCDTAAGVLAAGGAVAARMHSWPVATVVAALARPDRFIYIKPASTRKGVDRLGLAWDYKADPNATTYAGLMAHSRTLLEALRPHGAQDFIDVQSFLSVIGE